MTWPAAAVLVAFILAVGAMVCVALWTSKS